MTENLIQPETRRADALKNRALLLEVARRLFADHGFEAVSMTAIAEAAGVGKGTLYRHFENKVELAQALLNEAQRDLQNRTLQYVATPLPPLDKLRWFVEQVIYFVTENEALLFGSTFAESILMMRHPAHSWWRQTILALLQQIRPHGDLNYLADVIYVMLDIRTIQYQLRDRGYDIPRVVNGLQTLMVQLTS